MPPMDSSSEWLPLLLGPYGVVVLLAGVLLQLWRERKESLVQIEKVRAELQQKLDAVNAARLAEAQANAEAMEAWNEELHKTIDRLASVARTQADCVDPAFDHHARQSHPMLPPPTRR